MFQLYTKFKEKKERKIKEREVLDKIILANYRKRDKLAVRYKVNESHHNVLDNYRNCGINVSPLRLFSTNQENLKKFEFINELGLGLSYNPESYINGMYLFGDNIILLDKDFVNSSSQIIIKHTIAHEYGHNLWDRLFSDIQLNFKYGPIVSKRPKLPKHNKNLNLIDKIRLNTISNKKITEDEKRKIEFDRYFEEMFVDSVALYVNGIIDGEIRFFSYSKLNQGDVLGKDEKFMDDLEYKLHKIFYDEMFTKGLRRTVAELPFIYSSAKRSFEKRYVKELPEHVIAL